MRLEGEPDHLSLCSAEVENAWSFTYTPLYAFIAWFLGNAMTGVKNLHIFFIPLAIFFS
jgi:hypothetical protein